MDSLRPRTVIDYISLARRRKLRIAIPALIVLVASCIAIKRLPDIYESTTFILVESAQQEQPGSIDLARRLNTVRQQVTARSRLSNLIRKYGLYRAQAQLGESEDALVADMRADISVVVSSSRPDAADAFAISYRAKDPNIAQSVTSDLAGGLIASSTGAIESQASGEADVIAARVSEISSQLHNMESTAPWLLSLKDDSLIGTGQIGRASGPSPESVRAREVALGQIQDQQYKLTQQIGELNQRIAAEKQIVEKQKKNPGPQDGSALGALLAKRAELEGQRDNLIKSQGLTDKHPKVVAVEAQIDAVNRAISEVRRQEAGAVSETPEQRDLAALELQRDQLTIELEVAGRQLDRQEASSPVPARTAVEFGPAIPRDAGSARLAQQYLSLKQSYKEMNAKLQDARLQSQIASSGKVDRFRVVDPANLPQMPAWPNRRVLFLMAAAMSLSAGIALFVLLELRRMTALQDAADVEYYTALPLLASIPPVMTSSESAVRPRKAAVAAALTGMAAVVLTIALAWGLSITRIFEMLGRR